jgi:hypothetical protein
VWSCFSPPRRGLRQRHAQALGCGLKAFHFFACGVQDVFYAARIHTPHEPQQGLGLIALGLDNPLNLFEERARKPPSVDLISMTVHSKAMRTQPQQEFIGNLGLFASATRRRLAAASKHSTSSPAVFRTYSMQRVSTRRMNRSRVSA